MSDDAPPQEEDYYPYTPCQGCIHAGKDLTANFFSYGCGLGLPSDLYCDKFETPE